MSRVAERAESRISCLDALLLWGMMLLLHPTLGVSNWSDGARGKRAVAMGRLAWTGRGGDDGGERMGGGVRLPVCVFVPIGGSQAVSPTAYRCHQVPVSRAALPFGCTYMYSVIAYRPHVALWRRASCFCHLHHMPPVCLPAGAVWLLFSCPPVPP